MKTNTKALLVLAEKLNLDLFYVISLYDDCIKLQGRYNKNSKKQLSVFCNIKKNDGWEVGEFTFEGVLFEVTLT